MLITLIEGDRTEQTTIEVLAASAPVHTELGRKVPGAAGKAITFLAWYEAWTTNRNQEPSPTHLYVEATDEFTATIPWHELGEALFLYEQNGAALQKGFPMRLYVPDGSSACLNVKSVNRIEIRQDPSLGQAASYGFKNQILPDALRKWP